MKDRSKLFEHVPEKVYEENYRLLTALRAVYPVYRDDQLLMRILCSRALPDQNPMALKKCGNPECENPHFLSGNKNRKFCSEPCAEWAQRKSKREWWNEHGSRRRREARAKGGKEWES